MRLFAWLLLAAPGFGQRIDVYSEFRRLNAKGAMLDADQGGKPREILSPALIRNGWHSYHVVVTVQTGRDYAVHVVQNPERLRMRLFRELPDSSGALEYLEPAKLSEQGKAARTPDVYLLEVFVPAAAPAGRVRIEIQVHDGYTWATYPMEARVFAGIVPAHQATGGRLAAVREPSSETARLAFREYACGEAAPSAPVPRGIREAIRRNALQDAALARMLESKAGGREALLAKLAERAGSPLCGAARPPADLGPEWYLRIRDYLFRETSH